MADLVLLSSTAAIALGVQLIFFAFAAYYKSDKLTDLSYGLTFILLTFYLFFKFVAYSPAQLIIAWAIIIWGSRLVIYLFNRILIIKKDKRFDGIRENTLKFASFWLFQGITVWIIMLPHILALSSERTLPLGWSTWLGLILWAAGLSVETIADRQKFKFKTKVKNKDKWIESGLWRYSRHPNYFGEIILWWGLFILALPFLNAWQYLSVIGPLFITFILLFVSGIPPLEKRYNQKYDNNKSYQEYKERTSLLIPLPRSS